MALPDYTFIESSSGNNFLLPDSIDTGSELISKEAGGVAISNPNQGLLGYVWQSVYTPASGRITLRNVTTSIDYIILNGVMNVTTLSFAFDSNMRPVICYTVVDGGAYYYWYDTVTQGYLTTQLPAGSITPKVCHDDKRAFAVTGNKSDVLLFYVKDGIIWHRVQRERFLTDHQIATCTAGTRLKNVGMTVGLRVKLRLANGGFISSP